MPTKAKRTITRDGQKQLEQHIERVERKLAKQDPRSDWIRSHNMKQYCVTLTGSISLPQVALGAASTFSGKLILSPNHLRYSVTGGDALVVPQSQIWDEYAKLYDFWMAEAIELKFLPAKLCVETTTTGVQDTAIQPTAAGHIPDTSSATVSFFDPSISYAAANQLKDNVLARKGGALHEPDEVVRVRSKVSNTLLLKQDAPMLRTNGSVAARETYGTEAGACVIIPVRAPTTRIPFGDAQFTIHYRFAGRVQPGIADLPTVPSAQTLPGYTTEVRQKSTEESVEALMDQIKSILPKSES